MTMSVLVHVGLPRAGTRHLQHVLAAARDDLAAVGVRYPGRAFGAHLDVPLEARLGAYLAPHLDQVRADLARHGGIAVVSAEQFAVATTDQARDVLDRLGVGPGAARVVVTARELGRLLPSGWQSEVERGSTEHFDDYLAAVTTDGARRLRSGLDLPAVVRRWSEAVGPEHVAVVTVPRHGGRPGLLWTRFGVAGGLRTATTETAAVIARHPAGHADDVLGGSSQVQLLRTVNETLRAQGYPVGAQQELRTRLLAVWQRLLAPTAGRLTVPGPARPAVREWAADDVRQLRASGVHLVGPLTDLDPRFGPPPGPQQRPVDTGLGRDVIALLTRDRFAPPAMPPAQRSPRRSPQARGEEVARPDRCPARGR